MPWNWELSGWPHFVYDHAHLISFEKEFLQGSGGAGAILRHLEGESKRRFIVDVLCAEGLNSAEIEGEILERMSLQSSIQRHFGLLENQQPVSSPRELGMGELLCEVYDSYDQLLTHDMLCKWHRLLMNQASGISDIGQYRSHEDPMQIISGRYDRHIVHFEAPPSSHVHDEMTQFIQWFNDAKNMTILERAGITHVYFESIHPFEDGNGRIGRALVEKALSQDLGHPTLLAISQEISKRKKEYYGALASCNRTLDISRWMTFFAEVVVQAQTESLLLINFLIAKSAMMTRLNGKINARQEKVLLRLFAEGTRGFSGGLSAENYIAITKTSRATATRDLVDLVEKKALRKTGHLRHTRYWLNLEKD